MTERRWDEEGKNGRCGCMGCIDPEYDFEGLSLAYKQVQDSSEGGKRRS